MFRDNTFTFSDNKSSIISDKYLHKAVVYILRKHEHFFYFAGLVLDTGREQKENVCTIATEEKN